jgi:predicted nucleotidyltransferase
LSGAGLNAESVKSAGVDLAISSKHLALVQGILTRLLPEGAKAYVFGSRVFGTTKRASDLDLAIDAGRPMTAMETVALADAFDESDLPYRVDMVDMQTVSASFKAIIDRDKVSLPLQ